MPESENREPPPELATELAAESEFDRIELDIQALAKIKAEIAARDPLVRVLKGDA